jgi:hypothetical protein
MRLIFGTNGIQVGSIQGGAGISDPLSGHELSEAQEKRFCAFGAVTFQYFFEGIEPFFLFEEPIILLNRVCHGFYYNFSQK